MKHPAESSPPASGTPSDAPLPSDRLRTGTPLSPRERLEQVSKQELRRYVRSLKKQFTNEELVGQSASLVRRVLAHPRLRAAGTVLLYNSLPDEVYTHTLIRRLHAEGKKVLLPVVISDTEMEIRHYTSPASFRESSYGILEPVGEAFTDFPSITFALIPGMAFDAGRHRLGRGKGYYDRFLPLLTNAYKLGICFPFQALPSIPTDEHDQLVDEVIY